MPKATSGGASNAAAAEGEPGYIASEATAQGSAASGARTAQEPPKPVPATVVTPPVAATPQEPSPGLGGG